MGLAQASSSSDRETIRLLVQQVKELQEKVKALEAKQSDSEATPPQPTTSCWKVVGCGGVASESDCLASSALTFSWSSLTCWTRRRIVSRSLELLACARPMPVNN